MRSIYSGAAILSGALVVVAIPAISGADDSGDKKTACKVCTGVRGPATTADKQTTDAIVVEPEVSTSEDLSSGEDLIAPSEETLDESEISSFENLRPGEPAEGDVQAAHTGFGRVLFEFDKFSLENVDCGDIDLVKQWLEENPDKNLVIEGHTDPIGTEVYNTGLATRRGEAVRTALVALGIAPERLVVGVYGEANPEFDSNRLNRRVELIGTDRSVAEITANTFDDEGIAVVWDIEPDLDQAITMGNCEVIPSTMLTLAAN